MKENVFLFVEEIVTEAYWSLFLFVKYILNHLLLKQSLFISLFCFWHMSANANVVLMDRAVVKVIAHMHTNSSLCPSLSDLSHLNIVSYALCLSFLPRCLPPTLIVWNVCK